MPDGQGGNWLFARIMEFVHTTGLTYVWLMLLAAWGGTASYLARVRKLGLTFSFAEWLGELVISGFSGIVTAYLCMWAGFPPVLTFAFAGVAGHMGGRAITLIETGATHWVRTRWFGGKSNEDRAE